MNARQTRKPLVSVVIPTLNRPTLLSRAINSVLRQTFKEFEVTAVVDKPDPDTVDAVHSVDDPRVRLIRNPDSLTAAGATMPAPTMRRRWSHSSTTTMSGCRTSWKSRSLSRPTILGACKLSQ